jgi:hypothetical protein
MQLAVSTSPNHTMLRRRKNVWYSVKDGNWSDPNTWMSNALDRRNVTMPQAGDDVVINHNVIVDMWITVNNLYIAGSLLDSSITNINITVNGDLQATGIVNFAANNSNISLVLNGYNNFINSFSSGTSSTIIYGGYYDQRVLNLSYRNLTTQGFGNKYLTANTTISGNLSVFNLECLGYDLTVNGTTTVSNTNQGKFGKSGSGNLLFIGQFTSVTSTIDWSGGNPNVEFRGGIAYDSYKFNTGTGTFKFTTNNQTFFGNNNISGTWNAPILISGAITLTNIGGSNLNSFSTINGDNASSTLNNDGKITLNNTTVPMATGIFNYMHGSTSAMAYNMTGNYTLPYTSYINLMTGLPGTKSSGGTTTITGNLTVNSNFDCGIYDLIVNGTTNISNGADGSAFKKTGAGNLLFIGQFGLGGTQGIDWSGGNPNVEFRGGFALDCYFFNTGTGTLKFTTNNQNISLKDNNTGSFVAPILISGAITVTNISSGTGFSTTGVINGDNTNSVWNNNGYLNYQSATAPMATGKLYCNQAANTFIYGLAGNQDIQVPSDPTPGYKNLTLNGSGAKRLLGNVSVKGTYTLTPPATLDSNGFALTNP